MSSWSMKLEGGAQRWIWQSSTSDMVAWFGSSLGLQSLDGSPGSCYPKTFTQKIVHSCWSQELIVLPDWWVCFRGTRGECHRCIFIRENSPFPSRREWTDLPQDFWPSFVSSCHVREVLIWDFISHSSSLFVAAERYTYHRITVKSPAYQVHLDDHSNFNVGARKVPWSLPMKLSRRIWWDFFLMTYCQLLAAFPPFSNCPWDWGRIVYSLHIASGHIGEHVFSDFSQLNPRP